MDQHALPHDQDALYIHHGNAAPPGLDRNIATAEGKTSALQWDDADIENAVWRNVDGVWTRLLRYRSTVERDVAVHSVPEKFGRIEYTRSIVGIGDPEDGWLIAPQLHLMRLESLSGDADLGQTGRRPIDRLDNRRIPLARWSRRKQ